MFRKRLGLGILVLVALTVLSACTTTRKAVDNVPSVVLDGLPGEDASQQFLGTYGFEIDTETQEVLSMGLVASGSESGLQPQRQLTAADLDFSMSGISFADPGKVSVDFNFSNKTNQALGNFSLQQNIDVGGSPAGQNPRLTNQTGFASAGGFTDLINNQPLGSAQVSTANFEGCYLAADNAATTDDDLVLTFRMDYPGTRISFYIDLFADEINPTNVLFVDADQTSSPKNGLSWGTAFQHLREALRCAKAGQEIWVAEGTYYPDDHTPAFAAFNSHFNNDRSVSFSLKSGVGVYGGFAGNGANGTEANRSDAKPSLNKTILSGEIQQDNDTTNNSLNVFENENIDNTAILSGFTITAGYAVNDVDRTSGGGMYNSQSSPTLSQLIFVNNEAESKGGALGNWSNSNPLLANVVFVGNISQGNGGAIYNDNAAPVIANTTFVDNSSVSGGNAIYDNGTSFNNVSSIINNIFGAGQDISKFTVSSESIINLANNYFIGDFPFDTGNINIGGNFSNQPDPFVDSSDPDGADNILGTADDGIQLADAFPTAIAAIDAGNPFLAFNLDILGNPRVVDDAVANGVNNPAIIDMGAYEKQTDSPLAPCSLNTIFVNMAATGLGNGNDWANAIPKLQDALTCATSGKEIWVAKGNYYPDEGTGFTDNDLEASFTLKNGVGIYGGFNGTEVARSAADPSTNVTILDGNITQSANPFLAAVLSFHVVNGGGTDNTAILSGFTITQGDADGSSADDDGGGMYNDSSSPSLSHLIFEDNDAAENGGAMYNANGSTPILRNVTFKNNVSGEDGGAIFNSSSSPELTKVIFENNRAGDFGGAMYNVNSDPKLVNVVFSENKADTNGGDGGGMYNLRSDPTLSNVVFVGNTAPFANNFAFSVGGGEAMFNNTSSPILRNVTFEDNAFVSLFNSKPEIYNSVFGSGSPIQGNSTTDVKVKNTYSVQAFGASGVTSVSGNINNSADPFVDKANPIGSDGIWGTADDGLRLKDTSTAVNGGDNNELPADVTDLDEDGNTAEQLPFDITNNTRIFNGVTVDMGAYENIKTFELRIINNSLSNVLGDFTCDPDKFCFELVAFNKTVTLEYNGLFVDASGCDGQGVSASGNLTCIVTMTSDKSVTFEEKPD